MDDTGLGAAMGQYAIEKKAEDAQKKVAELEKRVAQLEEDFRLMARNHGTREVWRG